MKIIVDYEKAMDSETGPLYCTPKFQKLTMEEIQNIIDYHLNDDRYYDYEDSLDDDLGNWCIN